MFTLSPSSLCKNIYFYLKLFVTIFSHVRPITATDASQIVDQWNSGDYLLSNSSSSNYFVFNNSDVVSYSNSDKVSDLEHAQVVSHGPRK